MTVAIRWRDRWMQALACLVWMTAGPQAAAQDGEGGAEAAVPEPEAAGPRLAPEEARELLAQPAATEPDARFAQLQRQYRAAMRLDERGRVIEITRELVERGRGRAEFDDWVRTYLSAEFSWGTSGRALQAAEALIADKALAPVTRATVALRQTYYAAQGNDRAITLRLWGRADSLAREQLGQEGDKAGGPVGSLPSRLRVDHLLVRSEVERINGNPPAAVSTLREAYGVARRLLEAVRAAGRTGTDPLHVEARGMLDASQGQLVYALVQAGRPQEASELAQGNVAQFKAGQMSESLGARWLYRQATALVATQQYEAGLAAAQQSDQLLERAGAGAASHVRWLARAEIVRALVGLRRWQEADASYRSFLTAMPPDALARNRASDNRLLALLAAKNGRFEEGLDMAERMHRFRLRLLGPNHPLTHEAAGLRAVVRLLRGEVSAAMADYEVLFSTLLDTPTGWLDLDTRGVRGFVFGIAFDEFLHFVAGRALKGERVERDLAERAMQVADRMNLSVTQRALTDSTSRVLAATPALRALLEAEQAQRQASREAFSGVQTALNQADALRSEAQSEAFKARPESERRAHMRRLREHREQLKQQQEEAAAARTRLEAARQQVAREFPGYAELVTPTIPSARQLGALLQAGEGLLVVQPTERATLVWLLVADAPTAFAASPLTRSELAARVSAVREMLDLGAAAPGQRPPLRPELLHALWRDLFAGIEPALADVRSLMVATSSSLAALPLSALVTAAPAPAGAGQPPLAWLARRMAVTQLPASASLHSLRRVAEVRPAPRPLLAFGDPLFDFSKRGAAATAGAAPAAGRRLRARAGEVGRYDAETGFRYADIPPLPETRAELLAVAEALGADAKNDVVLGEHATRRAVLAAPLAERRVVAFATHGLLPGELPGVGKPALAMAAEADPKEPALLELDDVLGLRLNAQWVLLSACNTAAGEQGGAAMSGLVRGFFFAGTRSVLATHWAVETESAAALSAATFRAQRGSDLTRAEALRRAQLAMIDGSTGGGRWGHPFYWAPYALFGDPAR
ncbi:MAG: CHAT domain-containing protein [Rubrivivax sp.]|nr:CHAT domain-containing protein [Rubrivivax sp.]